MQAKKNLLITGGANRIGREIALHFSKKGWNIALHYFKSSSKAKKLKKIIEPNWSSYAKDEIPFLWSKVALIKADLKNAKQVEKIIPRAKKQLGTIDCLINNAALFEKDDISNFLISSLILAASSNSRLAADSFIFLFRDFRCFFKFPPTFDPSDTFM